MCRGVSRRGEGCCHSGQQIPRVGKVGGKMNKLNKNFDILLSKKLNLCENSRKFINILI
jgi:hypothetical protein